MTTTYLTYSGPSDQRTLALELLRHALAPTNVVEECDGRASFSAENSSAELSALNLVHGWKVWVAPELAQAQANQLAGALWASTLVCGLGLGTLLWAVFPNLRESTSLLGMWAVLLLTTAPSTMALLSFVMPVRPQWGRAIGSIRVRGFSQARSWRTAHEKRSRARERS